jgi:Response regulator containing CheY-like receiver, AAA-type ATPase, and DNA-binding domains
MRPLSPCGKVPTARAKLPARVLIIDNELLVRWSLSAGLGLAGFEAVTASSGAEALTLARQPPHPDVVLLDSRLYDTDPAALLEDLRLAAPRCRFLMLTTAGQEMPTPPWDGIIVIRKPFDLAEVVRLVDAAAAPPHALSERVR